jgi:hypothetical protein
MSNEEEQAMWWMPTEDDVWSELSGGMFSQLAPPEGWVNYLISPTPPPSPDIPIEMMVSPLNENDVASIASSPEPAPPSPQSPSLLASPDSPVPQPDVLDNVHECSICLISDNSTSALHDHEHYVHGSCLAGLLSNDSRVIWDGLKFQFSCPMCRANVEGSLEL